MSECPFCQSDVGQTTHCSSCHARKGYLRIGTTVFGSVAVFLFGVAAPLLVALLGISAQNGFGLWVALMMTIPSAIALIRLLLGQRWYRTPQADQP